MGGDDQTLVDTAEQTHVTSAEQENETVDNARNVEDKSSRCECLQSFSSLVQCKEGYVPEKCVNGWTYLLWKDRYRALNNSGISNFVCGRTYICEKYTLPGQEDRVPFRVEYVPARQTLFVKMPVKYVNGSFNARGEFSASSELRPGTQSEAAVNENFKTKYENTIHDMWSSESTNLWLYLRIIYSGNEDGSCDCHSWSKISPIRVDVSVDDVDKKNGYDSYYSVFYISRACYDVCPKRAIQYRSHYRTVEYDVDGDSIADRCCTDYYRNRTSPSRVIFSKETFLTNPKTFAHEFGHQIGLGDEYAIDYKTIKIGGEKVCVYRDAELSEHKLKAYERTEGVREYTLPREKFNHEGKNYSAEEKIFVVGKKEKNGVVLKIGSEEQISDLEGLQSPNTVSLDDINGNRHQAVYLFDDGKLDVVLKAFEKAGVREYDLEELSNNRTHGARIYHNGKKYSVGKYVNDGGEVFYYLVNEDGSKKDHYLDGTYTRHTQMAADEFDLDDPEYANKNATMYDKAENTSQGLNDNLMNSGTVVKKHYYIPFKKAMAKAIQKDYGDEVSDDAPNMEDDWKIG